MSKNPEERLKMHNAGMTSSTKHRRPFKIIYKENYKDRVSARKKEKYLKGGSGRESLKQLKRS
jgi:putative endonuclease